MSSITPIAQCTFHPGVEASHLCVTCNDKYFCASCEVRYHGVYSVNRKHVRHSIRKAFTKTTSPCQLCSAPATLLHCYDCIGPSDSGINMCVGCLMNFHTTEVGAGHRILPEGAPPDFVLSYRVWRQRAQVRVRVRSLVCLSRFSNTVYCRKQLPAAVRPNSGCRAPVKIMVYRMKSTPSFANT